MSIELSLASKDDNKLSCVALQEELQHQFGSDEIAQISADDSCDKNSKMHNLAFREQTLAQGPPSLE